MRDLYHDIQRPVNPGVINAHECNARSEPVEAMFATPSGPNASQTLKMFSHTSPKPAQATRKHDTRGTASKQRRRDTLTVSTVRDMSEYFQGNAASELLSHQVDEFTQALQC